jgi:hypothetical protein
MKIIYFCVCENRLSIVSLETFRLIDSLFQENLGIDDFLFV